MAYLVQTALAMCVCDDLDGSFCAVCNVQARGNADAAQTEVAITRDLNLRVQNNTEAVAGVVADSHVHSYIGLLMSKLDLDWSTADRKIGARSHGVETSAWEGGLFILIETTRCRIFEVEMGQCHRSKRECDDRLGQHCVIQKLAN